MAETSWASFQISADGEARQPLPVALRLDDRVVNFMRFHAYPPNEMFFGFAGLEADGGTICCEYPERKDLNPRLAEQTRYDFSEAKPTNMPLEHISIHSGGQSHLKIRGEKARPLHIAKATSPITANTDRFLEMRIISDAASRYACEVRDLPSSSIVVDCMPSEVISVGAFFSGANFNLQALAAKYFSPVTPAIRLQGRDIQGLLLVKIHSGAPQEKRPPGTLVAVRVFTASDRCSENAFHVC